MNNSKEQDAQKEAERIIGPCDYVEGIGHVARGFLPYNERTRKALMRAGVTNYDVFDKTVYGLSADDAHILVPYLGTGILDPFQWIKYQKSRKAEGSFIEQLDARLKILSSRNAELILNPRLNPELALKQKYEDRIQFIGKTIPFNFDDPNGPLANLDILENIDVYLASDVSPGQQYAVQGVKNELADITGTCILMIHGASSATRTSPFGVFSIREVIPERK